MKYDENALVRDLKISTRTMNVLLKSHNSYVISIADLSDKQLLSIKGFGKKSLDELRKVIPRNEFNTTSIVNLTKYNIMYNGFLYEANKDSDKRNLSVMISRVEREERYTEYRDGIEIRQLSPIESWTVQRIPDYLRIIPKRPRDEFFHKSKCMFIVEPSIAFMFNDLVKDEFSESLYFPINATYDEKSNTIFCDMFGEYA